MRGPSAVPAAKALWYEGDGGYRLRAAIFPAPQAASGARGSVVLSPGRGELIEKYAEVIGELGARGFTVLVHDWRGHGLSQRLLPKDPLKGHADGWRPFVADYRRMLAAFESQLPRPWIAMGHSMGGALTALALIEGVGPWQGAILSAPMLGLNLHGAPFWLGRLVAAANVRLGRAEALALPPDLPLDDAFEGNVVTHDEARWQRNFTRLKIYPEVALAGPTWGWMDFALTASVRILAGADKLKALGIPLSILMAGEERLADNARTIRVAAKAGAALTTVDGAYHEILMETDERRAVFWSRFDDLARQIAAP